jgi:D-alanyl-D-alanine carboxypeptidase
MTPIRNVALPLALLALAAAPCAAASAAGDQGRHPREAEFQRSLDRVVAAGVPGAVVLVRAGGRTTRLTAGYGALRSKRPMRAEDRFRVGSITKSFVATVVLQLVAERRLALEDPVERWLPGLVPDGERITVRQLLNHTSGLFAFGADRGFVSEASRDPLRVWAPRQIISIATAHPPMFAPGARWSYSDTNYFVLGLIVERVTGRPLAADLERRILAPLRLRATSLPAGPDIAGPHAHGYFLRPLQDVTVGSPSVQWAAGALVSDADDVARFFRALLGGRLVRPDLLALMRTTVAAPQLGPGAAYGLGLLRVGGPCGALWGHTGASPGYVADALNSRGGTRQVVVLANATGGRLVRPDLLALMRTTVAVDRLTRIATCP